MSLPLEGRVVLVTRPRVQAAALVAGLEARGATVLVAPAIRIAGARSRALDRALAALAAGEFAWVTLTSRSTVDVLASRVPPGDVRARVAAVGEGTAEAFARWAGRAPDMVPARFTTEALARAFPPGEGRVLCPRADVAPEGLEAALARKGWTPLRVDAYRTRPASSLPSGVRRALLAGEVDAVTFTSASTVRGFVAAAGSAPSDPALIRSRWPRAVCIGPVTSREARAAGFRVLAVADPHTMEGLVAAVERALARAARRPPA